MALLVWLPLNGNLNNQGLSNVAVSNSGATVNDNGKIGKCYEFNIASSQSGTKYMELNKNVSELFQSGSSFSLACFVKVSGDLYSNGCGVIECAIYKSSGFSLDLRRLSNGKCVLGMKLANNGEEQEWNSGVKIEKDIWYHICGTFDSITNKFSMYLDGVLRATFTVVNLSSPWVAANTPIGIGRGTQGGWGYTLPGYLNDVRIYDHCLSPKEVKEISQGLVLHYKLTPTNLIKNGWGGTENWPNNPQKISTVVPENIIGVTNSYSNIISKEHIPFAQNSLTTISQDLHSGDTVVHLTDASGWTNPTTHQYNVAIFGYKDSTGYVYPDMVYTRRVFKFGTTTDKSNIDVENKQVTLLTAYTGQTIPAGTSICLSSDGGTYYYPTVATGGDDWMYLTKTFVPQDIKMLVPARYVTVYAALNTGQWTTALTLIDNTAESTVYDCSGFGNNGTRYGNIQFLKDRPRYLSASDYYDSACAIGIGNLSQMVPEGIFTFNLWLKKTTDVWSEKPWETILGGPSGFELESKLGGTKNAYIHPYSWGGGNTTTPNAYSIAYDLDKWNMVTMVRDASNTKFYLNGELKVTGTRSSIPSGDYFIGAWKTATQQNYRGYLSDARIYATALSADDIKDLYNTSASIHNNASAEAFEFVEESSGDTQVTKTGIFEGKDIREISKNLFNKEEVTFNSANYGSYGPNAFEMKPLYGKVCPKRSIPIKPDTYYVLSYDETQVTINANAFNTVFWDITGTRSLAQLTTNANGLVNKRKFKSPADAYFVSFSNYGTLTEAQQQTLVNTLQFEEGETWTEYQEHSITNAAIYEGKMEAKQIIET